ncbi:UPF0058 family protein [Methanopyrus kandleri]|uniref:Predicted metal-binding protein conserved in archaea n=2 Tax=Methanopyrus kandleri TaxID=2320 RepID=Q8TXP5_METKA|nr:UPF0058 family protein [Methanopyrus kandleri]AAM01830.1 Predicted metal-binding protein conserved in archaea [Methanopyrus kandleri AV19]HII70162.1 UPF0058 family protein [Methanopyrus kandleri]
MKKDELFLLHSVLYYVLEYLKMEGKTREDDVKLYDEFNVKPGHLHKTKLQHKCAVFLLAYVIARAISSELPKAEGLGQRLGKLLEELFEELKRRGEEVPVEPP